MYCYRQQVVYITFILAGFALLGIAAPPVSADVPDDIYLATPPDNATDIDHAPPEATVVDTPSDDIVTLWVAWKNDDGSSWDIEDQPHEEWFTLPEGVEILNDRTSGGYLIPEVGDSGNPYAIKFYVGDNADREDIKLDFPSSPQVEHSTTIWYTDLTDTFFAEPTTLDNGVDQPSVKTDQLFTTTRDEQVTVWITDENTRDDVDEYTVYNDTIPQEWITTSSGISINNSITADGEIELKDKTNDGHYRDLIFDLNQDRATSETVTLITGNTTHDTLTFETPSPSGPYGELIIYSYRAYQFLTQTAELIGWASIVIGVMMYATTQNANRNRQSRRLIIGGVSTILAMLLITHLFEVINYVMTDTTDTASFSYPPQMHEYLNGGIDEILHGMVILSQTAATLGSAFLVFGWGVWTLGGINRNYTSRGKRIIKLGIAMVIISMSERLIGAVFYVFIDVL